MQREWVLSLRDQCEAAGVPYFFKQWGGVRKSEAGRELDGRTHDAIPLRAVSPVMGPAERRRASEEVLAPYRAPEAVEQPGLFAGL
jgi:hypothetical protein